MGSSTPFFNSKNEISAPVFKVKGLQKKPDFIVKINFGYGNEYIAIEIKNATSSRSVLDSGKIKNYYKNYFKGKTKYFIEDKEIEINHFTVATQNSINGHLFNEEKVKIDNLKSDDLWRRTNAKYKLEPKNEYSETSRFQRQMWNDFKLMREEYNIKNGASIGIIMSDFYDENIPFLFVMKYNSHLKKPKWGARWLKM